MTRDTLPDPLLTTGDGGSEGTAQHEIVQLHAETAVISKRVRRTLVRATRTTHARTAVLEEDLAREQVIVERVPIGRVVDAIPPVRQEGDVTILSVVEEQLVVEKRLILREEVHLRRIQSVERHTETVSLREQQVAISRTDLDQ